MKFTISIALATYNGELHIEEQLDSIKKQSVLPDELVICDDGSTDATMEIVKDFKASAPFPVHIYINETNLGYSDNFLKAAALCAGDWIAFCDQDDVWLPMKFARVREVIQNNPGDELVLIGHSSLIANAGLELTGQRYPDFRRDAYVKRATNFGFFCCITGFSMVYRAKLTNEVDATLRPRSPPGHDQWIGILANAVGDTVYISEPLAIWRRHEFSNTSTPKPNNAATEIYNAISSTKPDSYFWLGKCAIESAESFRQISKSCSDSIMKKRLSSASVNFLILSDKLFRRGELYKCQKNIAKKIGVMAKMLLLNAYGGPKFHSLGWRSFAKDTAFTLGIIGWWIKTET